MSKYDQVIPLECPNCGAVNALQEVQSVIATQPFDVNAPTKYSDIEDWHISEAFWDCSEPLYIECGICSHIVVDFREEGN